MIVYRMGYNPSQRMSARASSISSSRNLAKLATYVRWFVVGAFGLILLLTVIMAAYRKFGG